MNPQIEALVRQKIQQFNIMMGAQQQPGQQPGMAEGGMSRPGIIPGPVTPGGGDNTLTPTQTGEYIIPVDAVMGLGVRMGATSPGDALATGKFVLDKEVMGLKKEMGNNTPPRNAGVEMAGSGMAEGGFISGATDWVNQNIVQPVKNLVNPQPGIPAPPPLQPTQVGTGYLSDSGTKLQTHNQAVEEVARETGYAEGGYVDPDEFIDTTPAPTMGIPTGEAMRTQGVTAPPIAPAPVPAYSPVTDIDLGETGLSENVTRNKAIQQAMGGTGYTSLVPASVQPNLQPAMGIPAGQGVGAGGGKVTMTPTTEKLATDTEGYYKELPNVQPGTGIMSVGGKTFDVAGMAPEQRTGLPTGTKGLNLQKTTDVDKVTRKPLTYSPATGKYYTTDENNNIVEHVGEQVKGSTPVSVGLEKALGGKENANFWYEKYITENKMPTFGMGAAAVSNRLEFMKNAAEYARTKGLDAKATVLHGQVTQSAAKSLDNLQKQKDMTGQAEIQALRNLDVALKISDEYIRTKYPTPNKLLTVMRTESGDPKVEQFKLALLAASREYMRVVTGGSRSAAELSIEAQKQADKLLNTSKSWEVLKAQSQTMKQELANTVASYDEQIARIKELVKPVEGEKATPGGTTPTMNRDAELMMKDMRNPEYKNPAFKKKIYENLLAKGYNHDQIEQIAAIAKGI